MWNIYKHLCLIAQKKYQKCPGKRKLFDRLSKKFEVMHERIKECKENGEAKTPNNTEGPFYWFKCSSRSREQLLFRLKYKALRSDAGDDSEA